MIPRNLKIICQKCDLSYMTIKKSYPISDSAHKLEGNCKSCGARVDRILSKGLALTPEEFKVNG